MAECEQMETNLPSNSVCF